MALTPQLFVSKKTHSQCWSHRTLLKEEYADLPETVGCWVQGGAKAHSIMASSWRSSRWELLKIGACVSPQSSQTFYSLAPSGSLGGIWCLSWTQRKTKCQANCHTAFSSEMKRPLQMGGETHETPEVNKTSYVWGIGSWEDSQGPSPALQGQ